MSPNEKLAALLANEFGGDCQAFMAAAQAVVADAQRPHPRARTGRQTKRGAGEMARLWAFVEFLRWRDADCIEVACNRLQKWMEDNGDAIQFYDTPDHQWHRFEEPRPPVDYWRPQINRQLHHTAGTRADCANLREVWLEQMKALHEGRKSALPDSFLQEALPPPRM